MKQFRISVALVVALVALPAAAAAQTLSPNAPPDRPVALSPKTEEEFNRMIQPHVDSARATWPAARERFLRGLDPRLAFFAVTRLHDAQGREEQVFVAVDRIERGHIYGRIASQIGMVSGYRYGQPYDFPEFELVDWVISHPDGSEEGNFVGKFLDTLQRQ
jgi:hypothetical protein